MVKSSNKASSLQVCEYSWKQNPHYTTQHVTCFHLSGNVTNTAVIGFKQLQEIGKIIRIYNALRSCW